jgi:hypothetical protein
MGVLMYKSGPVMRLWTKKKEAIVCNEITNRLFISLSENCTLNLRTASKLAYDWTWSIELRNARSRRTQVTSELRSKASYF